MVDYRFQKNYRAANGEGGRGRNCTGASGDDLELPVPVGTSVLDEQTGELLGDLTDEGQRLLVAQGGFHGLGNTRFKSSVNRAPRQTTAGSEGEERLLAARLSPVALRAVRSDQDGVVIAQRRGDQQAEEVAAVAGRQLALPAVVEGQDEWALPASPL